MKFEKATNPIPEDIFIENSGCDMCNADYTCLECEYKLNWDLGLPLMAD